jgi:regulatory protein YycI of two-component signal transduction system YycFG
MIYEKGSHSIVGNNPTTKNIFRMVLFLLIIKLGSFYFYQNEKKDAINLLKKEIENSSNVR